VFFDGSPENCLYLGSYRDFGYFHHVVGLYSRLNVIYLTGNGDHTFVQCSFGNPLVSGSDVAVFASVYSTKLFGCDFHGSYAAAPASAVAITGSGSYLSFHACVFNDNFQNGVRIFGGGTAADDPIHFIDCMFAANSQQTNATYHDIVIQDRFNVSVIGCKFLTNSGNKPSYNIALAGTYGDVTFDNNVILPSSAATGVTNAPLRLTNCGQYYTQALTSLTSGTAGSPTSTTFCSGTGFLNAGGTGNIRAIRNGNKITVHADCVIGAAGAGGGGTDIRFLLPYGTPVCDTFGVGTEIGAANVLVVAKVPSGSGIIQVRYTTSAFAYPGVNSAAITCSIDYLIA
jgi:hypothetical protein